MSGSSSSGSKPILYSSSASSGHQRPRDQSMKSNPSSNPSNVSVSYFLKDNKRMLSSGGNNGANRSKNSDSISYYPGLAPSFNNDTSMVDYGVKPSFVIPTHGNNSSQGSNSFL